MADLDSYCVPRESNKCELYTITNETVSFSPQRSCGRARHWIGLDRILSYLRGKKNSKCHHCANSTEPLSKDE